MVRRPKGALKIFLEHSLDYCSFVAKNSLETLRHGSHISSRSGHLIKSAKQTEITTIQAENILETVYSEIPKR